MADYPTALPSFTRVGNGVVGGADDPASDGSTTDAVVVVTDLQDEVEAVTAELGLSPSGAAATVAARFTALDSTVSGKEATGTAAAAVAAHAGATDPHGDRAYADAGYAALDAAVVHLTGDESVDGVKTFLDPPVSITPASSANELVSKAVMEAAIAAAIAAAIDGAPGALDTLNELAAALGDDPDYAATVTSALAAKADKAQNLSDLANIATARTNLGLGGAAVLSVGTTAGTVAAGDDSRFTDTRTPTDNTVATAKVQDGAITFAKLQDIATARLLGRTTASTGDVEELTAAQATAMLSAVVGDSGSGGTKGLVPAPGAGDAAAGKFLKADGTFAVPGGASGYATIKDEGTSLTQRATVDLIGAGVTAVDDSSNSKTKVTIPGAYPPARRSGAAIPSWPLIFGDVPGEGVQSRLYLIEYVVPEAGAANFTSVDVEVTTAVSGASVRIGVFDDDYYGLPYTLIADWGTVSATTTGVKDLTISGGWNPAAGIYFIGVCIQGAAAKLRFGDFYRPTQGTGAIAWTFPTATCFYRDSITGAFSSGLGSSSTVRVPYVLFP